jgi:TrwC relaxase
MVTAKTQHSLKNAEEYFEEHLSVGDYYDQGQRVAGEWIGLGAERIGLSGKVRAEDFLRLCENQHPARKSEVTSLPLPPQIISLADLEVTVNGASSESVVLDTFHIDLTAVGSDVRMLELSLQPTKYARGHGQTVYTWDYKRLLFGRPIALDVLGVAPIDRLGELTWLGPASVVVFGFLLGLIANAFYIQKFDRWMLLLVLSTFTGAYPLMYFAQEFIPLNAAIFISSAIVIIIIAIRSMTIMSVRLALLGIVLPAVAVLALTIVAAIQIRLQGLLITGSGLLYFIVAMSLPPIKMLHKSSNMLRICAMRKRRKNDPFGALLARDESISQP